MTQPFPPYFLLLDGNADKRIYGRKPFLVGFLSAEYARIVSNGIWFKMRQKELEGIEANRNEGNLDKNAGNMEGNLIELRSQNMQNLRIKIGREF